MAAYREIVKIFTCLQIFQKLYIQSKKCKSGIELNFLQENQWVHMSISPRSGAMGLVTILVHYNISNMPIFEAY